jgi:hypothetical protein
MILLKCPRCGRTAEAPDELVDEGQQCYACNVPVVIASSEVDARRRQACEERFRGMVIGACLGTVLVPLVGATGGVVGMSIAGGVAGAVFGLTAGVLHGWLDALGWSALLADGSWGSWVRAWVLVTMVLGCIWGVIAGASGELVEQNGWWATLIQSGFGGCCLGGFLGARWGHSFARTPDAE